MLDRVFGVLAFLLLLPTSEAASADLRPDLMVSAGDSITAAFIANTEASDVDNPLSTADLRPPLSAMPRPPNLQAIYDEIDEEIEPASIEYYDEGQERIRAMAPMLEHKGSLSWASGSSIESHYLRLSDYYDKSLDGRGRLRVLNVARSGARTKDLDQQADLVLYAWDSSRYRQISYVTLLIGANDACTEVFPGGTPENQMAWELRKFFAKLATIDQDRPVRVLVAGMPRIPDLGFEPFRHHLLGRRMSCEAIQHATKFCPTLVDWSDPKQYWANLAVVLRKNAVIEHEVKKAASRYPSLDIRFTNALFQADISVKQLAKDCFHPNALGQTEIADRLWKAQPWFK